MAVDNGEIGGKWGDAVGSGSGCENIGAGWADVGMGGEGGGAGLAELAVGGVNDMIVLRMRLLGRDLRAECVAEGVPCPSIAAESGNVLQHTATHCNTLQHIATYVS